jgi:hypothetical protein
MTLMHKLKHLEILRTGQRSGSQHRTNKCFVISKHLEIFMKILKLMWALKTPSEHDKSLLAGS